MGMKVAGNKILDKDGDIQKPMQQIRVTVIPLIHTQQEPQWEVIWKGNNRWVTQNKTGNTRNVDWGMENKMCQGGLWQKMHPFPSV